MRRLKFVLIICCIAHCVENRTMSWGNIQPRNLLMFDQFFYEQHQIHNFRFQSKHGLFITAIHVTDLTSQQNGGKVEIVAGGIGLNYVKLKLIKESEKSILLNIEIFGHWK